MFKKSAKILMISTIITAFLSPLTARANNFDVNKDGVVDSKDLEHLSNFFWTSENKYDFNNDNIVDTKDLALLAQHINSEDGVFIAYKDDLSLGSFSKNDLFKAIEVAKASNGVVKMNDEIVWDNQSYYIYSNGEVKSKTSTIRESINLSKNIENSIVVSKNGNVIFDKNKNYKKIMGVARVDVNLRNTPNFKDKSEEVIPNGSLVEVNFIKNGFYNVSYYKDNTLLTGYVPYYLDIIQDDINNSQLGYISAREESNANPAAVSLNPNDKGGASFGIWQFSTSMGTVDSFLEYTKTKNQTIYEMLREGQEKDDLVSAWKKVAELYHDDFYELQRSFTKKNYYDSLITLSRKRGLNLDILTSYVSTSNMLWSTSVQHGVSGTLKILKKIKPSNNLEDIIKEIYEERLNIIAKTYPPTSENKGVVSIYNGVKQRLENEKEEILRILRRELSY